MLSGLVELFALGLFDWWLFFFFRYRWIHAGEHSLLEFFEELVNLCEFFVIHYPFRVRQNTFEEIKLLLLKKQHHVVCEDECVARGDVNGFFEGEYRVFFVRSELKSKS